MYTVSSTYTHTHTQANMFTHTQTHTNKNSHTHTHTFIHTTHIHIHINTVTHIQTVTNTRQTATHITNRLGATLNAVYCSHIILDQLLHYLLHYPRPAFGVSAAWYSTYSCTCTPAWLQRGGTHPKLHAGMCCFAHNVFPPSLPGTVRVCVCVQSVLVFRLTMCVCATPPQVM